MATYLPGQRAESHRMKRILALAALVLIAHPAVAQPGPEQAVWIAYRCDAEKRCEQGTAFHIGGGIFYTNAHVAVDRPGFSPLTIARGPGLAERLGTAEVLCLNRRALSGEFASPYDIAKIRVSAATNVPALTTAVTGLVPGMSLTVIGFPGRSSAPVVSRAVIEEIEAFSTFALRLVTGRAGPGSSGSPVLNDRHQVVGILYGQDSGHPDLFYATTLQFADRVCMSR